MTRQQLDNSIDTSITNVNTVNGISPAADGANRKLMMNYVDERTPSYYVVRLYQTGTNNPNPELVFDNLQINPLDNTQVTYRNIEFTRTGIGEYRIRITCKQATTPTNMNKVSIMFGDSSCVIKPGYGNGGIGALSYRQWDFISVNYDDVIMEDDVLDGVFCTITLYP